MGSGAYPGPLGQDWDFGLRRADPVSPSPPSHPHLLLDHLNSKHRQHLLTWILGTLSVPSCGTLSAYTVAAVPGERVLPEPVVNIGNKI